MFGLIGAAISSVGGALCSALSGAGSFIGGALTKGLGVVGGLFKGAAGFLGKIGAKAGGFLNNMLRVIRGPLGPMGPIVSDELKKRAIERLIEWLSDDFKGRESIEDVGYRLEEASKPENSDWKKPEEFDTFEDYYNYLKALIPDSEIKKDKNRLREYECVGMAGLSNEASRIEQIDITPNFLNETARSNMNSNEVHAIISAFKSLGYDNVALKDYFDGVGSPEERQRIYHALLDALSRKFPELSLLDLCKRLEVMQKCSLDDKFMAENSCAEILKDVRDKQGNSEYVKAILEEGK